MPPNRPNTRVEYRRWGQRLILIASMAVGLLATSSAAGTPPERLRRISIHLIPELGEASIEPPLVRRRDLGRCAGRTSHATFDNPYSPLPPLLRPRHVRLTQVSGPAEISLRDSFLLEPGHRVSLTILPEEAPRLELGWRILPCGGRTPDLELLVEVEDESGAWTQVLPLRASTSRQQEGRRYGRFEELALPLPLLAGRPARLHLTLRRAGGENVDRGFGPAVVALGEPVITGFAPDPWRPLPLGPSQVEAAAPAPGAELNVLWIVIDAVRRDALGPGRSFEAPGITPHLDGLFAGGTSFTHAYALANQTRTSTVAMLASTPASIGGFHSHTWGFTTGRLDGFYRADPPLITRTLERHGWKVAHFGHNLFLFAGEEVGVDHGFPFAADFKAVPADAVQASEGAIAFIEANRDRRWAMMLNYTAPHTPYNPPEPWARAAAAIEGPERLGGFMPRSYIGELMWVDHNLGPVLERLEALDLLDRTVVVVTADHGEVMEPAHDCFSRLVGQPCMFNHSLTLYDDELRVPLAIALPGRVAPGQVVTTPVSHLDLAPTLLDLLGLPAEPRHGGRSLRPALEGRPLTQRPILADGRLASAILLGTDKLIVHSRDDDIAPPARRIPGGEALPLRELFDLAADPGETRNLARERPEVVDALLTTLRQQRAELRETFIAGRHPPARDDAADNAELEPEPEEPSRPTAVAPPVNLSLRVEAGPRGASLHGVLRVSASGSARAPSRDLLTCREARGCHHEADGAVSIRAKATRDEPAIVSLSLHGALVDADDVTLSGALHLDAEPLPIDRIRLGPWGLAFFAGQDLPPLRVLLAAARAEGPPLVQPGEGAVYLTADPAGLDAALSAGGAPLAAPAAVPSPPAVDPGLAPEDGVYDRQIDRRLGRDMRRVLRELGYTR